MSYRESHTFWRKLWRKEPQSRQADLSFGARCLLSHLVRYADDAGCLAPASATGHAAATLAQIMAVRPHDRRGFYQKIGEALEHGDDGEPACLVIVDGFFVLTQFEKCQANRRSKGATETVTETVTETLSATLSETLSQHLVDTSSVDKPVESFRSENDLALEDRREKIEDRRKKIDRSIEPAEKESEATGKQPLSPSTVSPAASAFGQLKESYRSRWANRYPKKRPLDLGRYEHELVTVLSKAEQEPGDTDQVLQHALDAFFADDSQEQFTPGHVPKGLVYHWDRYLEPYREQFRRQVRERRDDRYQRELEAEGEKRLAKALGNGAETDPEKANVIIAELMAGIGRTV